MGGADDDPLDNTADVETPERIRFRYHVAGPVRRALAYIIDLAIRVAVLVATAALTTGLGGLKASQGLWLVLLFVLDWGYGVFFESLWRGQTPGKRVLGLRVVKDGGYPVGFIDAFLRNLLRAADFLPVGYILGLLSMAGDRTFKRVGDRVAGTMVVIESAGGIDAAVTLTPPAAAAELAAFPHRPPVSPDELDAIELFLRRPRLSGARARELAELIAPLLAARMGMRAGDPVRFLGLLHQRALGLRGPASRSLAPGRLPS
jgi:uncharacterized RDD family membrane protein YckC